MDHTTHSDAITPMPAWRIVNCLIAPPRNILTYLLTYLLTLPRDVNKAGSLKAKAKAKSLKAKTKSLKAKAKARSLKAKAKDQG